MKVSEHYGSVNIRTNNQKCVPRSLVFMILTCSALKTSKMESRFLFNPPAVVLLPTDNKPAEIAILGLRFISLGLRASSETVEETPERLQV